MPPSRRAARPVRRPTGRAAGLVLALVALAALPVVGRLRVSPAMRTIAVGRAPTAVAVDARTRRVFVANYGSATVSVLDAGSGTVLATVPVAPEPSTLAIATTAGRVFVVSDNDRVSVLDAASGRLLHIVAVGQGAHTVAVHERAGRVYVTNAADDSVSLLEARSGRVLRTIPLGFTPTALAADERTDRVFLLSGAPHFQPFPTMVRLLDARSGTLLRTVPVGLSANALVVDARTGQVVVANSHDGIVLVLDGRTASVVRTVAVGLPPGELALDEHTGNAFVANDADASVSLVEAARGHVVRRLPLGLPPYALVVDQRRDRVVALTREEFVPAAPAGQVAVLDGRTGRLVHTVAVGADASGLALDERTGYAFVTAMNVYGLPPGSDLLRSWLRRWLPQPWASRLLPRPPATATGTVTLLDLSRL